MDERKQIALEELEQSLQIQLDLTEKYRDQRYNAKPNSVAWTVADSLVLESMCQCETLKKAYLLLRSNWSD